MIRASGSGIHYAEICAADGAIRFAGLTKDAYRALMTGLLPYQSDNGLWRQALQVRSRPLENNPPRS